nr:hypothetical protein [Candidatus Kapabacteria bacterium]
YPNQNLGTLNTVLSSGITLLTGASKSTFSGLRIYGDINFSTGPLDSIIIEKCYLNDLYLSQPHTTSSNHIIRNNIIRFIGRGGWNDHFLTNVYVSNNILGQIGNLYQPIVFEHNLIGYNNTQNGWGLIFNAVTCIFNNNVFFNSCYNFLSSDVMNNFFYNNIFAGYTPDTLNNSFENNFFNVDLDSIFINYLYDFCNDNPYINYSQLSNYRLLPNCVGKNSANDGTDIGIYGGLYPWNNIPSGPYTRSFTISPINPENGLINVNATAIGRP